MTFMTLILKWKENTLNRVIHNSFSSPFLSYVFPPLSSLPLVSFSLFYLTLFSLSSPPLFSLVSVSLSLCPLPHASLISPPPSPLPPLPLLSCLFYRFFYSILGLTSFLAYISHNTQWKILRGCACRCAFLCCYSCKCVDCDAEMNDVEPDLDGERSDLFNNTRQSGTPKFYPPGRVIHIVKTMSQSG